MDTLKDYGYTTETDFARDAAIEPVKRSQFKKFVRPMAEAIAKSYLAKYNLSQQALSELTDVGMASFNRAFKHYIRKTNLFEKGAYTFTTYFTWWIKQYIHMYLEQRGITHAGKTAHGEDAPNERSTK